MTIAFLLGKVVFRVRYAVWRTLKRFARPGRVHSFTLHHGLRFEYPLDSAIGGYLFAGGFEKAEIDFVRNHLQRGDVVLDIGANAGLYTIIAARLVGESGHIYAFEPGRDALTLLRNNIRINGLTNVTVIEAAVSNMTGRASFALATDSALSSLATTDRADQQIADWTTVTTIRLDDALRQHQIERVDFIKIDVEGAEGLVMRGAIDVLGAKDEPLTILFEAYDGNCRAFGDAVPDLLSDLKQCGFQLQCFCQSKLVPLENVHAGIGSSVYNFVASKGNGRCEG